MTLKRLFCSSRMVEASEYLTTQRMAGLLYGELI